MTRRKFSQAALIAAACLPALALPAYAELASPDFFTVVQNRHSTRYFTDEAVSQDDVTTLLRAAMQAPSAANEQPWEFIVITDKNLLAQVGGINKWAKYASEAPLGILVCLNTQKEKEKGMGILDIGICSENLMLAATALGLGSVFTGIYPYKDRMQGFAKLCKLPDFIEPVGLILVGHPKMTDHKPSDRFNPAAIHHNTWQSGN